MSIADVIADLPPETARRLDRAIKADAYADLFSECADDKAFSELVAFTIRRLIVEDPDFADLETYRDKLVEFVARLQGVRDAFYGYPWTRFPRDLGYHGHLARMSAGETRVYMALLCLSDPRTLVTCASIDTIAEMTGRSFKTVSRSLTGLKKRGLVHRWAKKHPNPRDEFHYLWYTKVRPEGCCDSTGEARRMLDTAALPRGR